MIYLLLIDTEEEKRKFALVYEKYRHYMFHIALKILKNSQDAEDAVHEAFIKLTKNMDKIGDVETLKTERYLYTIVKNTAIDIYRQKKRRFAKEVSVESPENYKTEKNEEISEYDEQMIGIIAALPPMYRDVIVLRYSSKFDNDKIASILGITENNVRQRLYRGKKMLQEAVEKMEAQKGESD